MSKLGIHITHSGVVHVEEQWSRPYRADYTVAQQVLQEDGEWLTDIELIWSNIVIALAPEIKPF